MWRTYDDWKSTEPDAFSGGAHVPLPMRHNMNLHMLQVAIESHDDLAAFWARETVRTARKLGYFKDRK